MIKLAAIWILFMYVGLNTIEVVNIHYCHGAFESVNIAGPNEDCCEDQHEDHADCCDDVTIEIDFDSEHLAEENLRVNLDFLQAEILLANFQITKITAPDIKPEKLDPGDESPPDPKYQLTHSFLFYG